MFKKLVILVYSVTCHNPDVTEQKSCFKCDSSLTYVVQAIDCWVPTCKNSEDYEEVC